MNYFSNDTIVAVATSLGGDGGVGIVRISGPKSKSIFEEVSKDKIKLKPRYLHRVSVRDPSTKEVLDDGMVVYFPHGKSFTGEDVFEFQLHGGRFLLQKIIQVFVSTGKCRLALPGEFSFRSVRNGKMTLNSAQAVQQIIAAQSTFEVTAARKNLSENRNRDFDQIADVLRTLLTKVELSIDFVDQDVEVVSKEDLEKNLTQVKGKLESLFERMRASARIAKGIQITLLGKPNAGKSTLFNSLLSEDRAIVSEEAGTTRDVITEDFSLGPYRIRLADTAGIRISTSEIESMGIEKGRDVATESDLPILVVDSRESFESLKAQISDFQAQIGLSLVVLNKIELLNNSFKSELVSNLTAHFPKIHFATVSSLKGFGVEELLSTIKQTLDEKFGVGLNFFLPTEFQLQMITACLVEIDQTIDLVHKTGIANPELISSSLQTAVESLSNLVGNTTPDSILTKIFSEFCIGK